MLKLSRRRVNQVISLTVSDIAINSAVVVESVIKACF